MQVCHNTYFGNKTLSIPDDMQLIFLKLPFFLFISYNENTKIICYLSNYSTKGFYH